MQVNQKVSSRRVDFKADQPFQHHQLELELESSLARGEIGQASWLTLPLTVLILATLLQWDKVGQKDTLLLTLLILITLLQ